MEEGIEAAEASAEIPMIAGVDGCKHGWIAAIEDERGETQIQPFKDFASILLRRDVSLILVDVPIGLPAMGFRSCDVQARRLLKRRGCCVFSAPIRSMLRAEEWTEACRIRLEVEGKKCSKQAFGILSKIREVDTLMFPELQGRVVEAHPEVSFILLNDGAPILSKKSHAGKDQRRSLLRSHFPDFDQTVARFGARSVIADILDAYACLWTARRLRRGEHRRLPPEAEVDDRGLRMEIVA